MKDEVKASGEKSQGDLGSQVMEAEQQCRTSELLKPGINIWTAILASILAAASLTMTGFIVIVGIFGFSTLKDMNEFRQEVDEIREVRVEMQRLQAAVAEDQTAIDASISDASRELANLEELVAWIEEELDWSVAKAESRYGELASQIDDLRSTLRNFEYQIEELRSDADEIHSTIRKARDEADSLGL